MFFGPGVKNLGLFIYFWHFFDKYGLLEDNFTEVETKYGKYYIRYFKKEFIDTFTNEDWYYKSLEEEADNWYDPEDDA